jgi:glucose-6-phosphate 1-epimerase
VKREISSAVAITGEVDRVYEDMNPTVPVSIISTENNNTPQLSITREMLNTVTLWNPWVEKAKGMSDFGDEEYKVMVCVEPGAVSNFQSLEAGDSWVGSQTIKAHF